MITLESSHTIMVIPTLTLLTLLTSNLLDPKTPMHRGFNPQSPHPLQSPGYDATSPGWGADMASPSYEARIR